MDKINKIIDVILSEAQDQADQILMKADLKIAQSRSENDAQIEKIKLLAEDEIATEQESIAIKTESLIETRSRQKRLVQRQQLISEVIDLALKKFSSLSDQEKVDFYTELIDKRNIKAGEISLNRSEQSLLPQLLNRLGTDFSAGEVVDISGGVIIEHERIENNLSLDLIIRDNRPELSVIVSDILFSAEE